MNTDSLQWFLHDTFTRLEIKKYVSGKFGKVIVIEDGARIKDLVERISKLPANGDKMKSWADDVEIIELRFISTSGDDVIEVYRDSIKTPSTGFNDGDAEKALAEDIKDFFNSPFKNAIKRLFA